jgi:ribosome-associated toxin RatA of RatAB toxin-antitoxin module
MADRTESSVVIDATPHAVLAVIADFGAYPEWAQEVREATVLREGPDHRPERVRFTLDAGILKDTYTLRYTWQFHDGAIGELTWSLLDSTVLNTMNGAYRLRPHGAGTEVTYALEVDLKVPMLGMLRRRAERSIVGTALTALRKRVEG